MAITALTSSMILQNQRSSLFEQTEKNFQTIYSQWGKKYDDLEEFKANINTRGSDLQHEKTKNPGKAVLEIERDGYLTQYWDFKATSDKIGEYVGELSKIITMYLPKERNYSDEKKLQSEQPEFYQKLMTEEETNKTYLLKLQQFSEQATTLKNKYVETLNSQGWSLQRYCQIVDNEGRPIPWSLRASNNIMNTIANPAIPKPSSSATTIASSSNATLSQPQTQTVSQPQSSPQTQTVSQPQSQSETQAGTTTLQPQSEIPESQAQPQSQTGNGDVEPAKGNNASSSSTPNITEYEKTADSNKPKNQQAGNPPSKRDSANKFNKS